MHILFATGIFPPDIGGPATMLAHLASDLIRRGFEVKVITYAQEYKNIKIQEYKNTEKKFDIYRIKKNNKLKYFWQLLKLSRWADLIYATDTYSVGYFAYLLKKIPSTRDKKYILRFTGDSAWEISRSKGWTEDYIVDFVGGCHPEERCDEGSHQPRQIQNKIKKLKARRNKILFNADKIIVDSQFNKNLAEKIGVPAGKIKVIYNAIDFETKEKSNLEMVNQIKNKYGQGAKIIVTACRLTAWKGVEGIITVLPLLKQKIGPVNFLVLGSGPTLNHLKELSQNLKVDNCVYFLGKIAPEQIVNYFQAADLLILNSQYEGLSHTLLQAMATGLPIITTKVGGNPELIENGKSGLLVNYNNESELLEALRKILRDKEFSKRLADNAREKVKVFRWEDVVEGTVNLIKQLFEK